MKTYYFCVRITVNEGSREDVSQLLEDALDVGLDIETLEEEVDFGDVAWEIFKDPAEP